MSIHQPLEPADLGRIGAIGAALAFTFGVADTETAFLLTGLLTAPELIRMAMANRASRAARETLGDKRIDDSRPRLHATISTFSVCVSCAAIVTAFVLVTVVHMVAPAIAILVVAGASGMAGTIGVATSNAMVRTRRAGVRIRARVGLEAVWSLDTVVVGPGDAIALGEMRVCAVYPIDGVSAREVVESAAAAESRCDHPIARAVVRHAREKRIPVPPSGRCLFTPGHGVRAFVDGQETLVGNSDYVTAGRMPDPVGDDRRSVTVFVVRGGRYLGAVAITDVPRQETKQAVTVLKSMTIETFLFAADSRPATERVARDMAIDHFEPGLDAEAAVARLQKLAASRKIAVVAGVLDDAARLGTDVVRVSVSADAPDDSADVLLNDGQSSDVRSQRGHRPPCTDGHPPHP